MTGLFFILAAVVTEAGFIWVRISGSPGLVRDPVRNKCAENLSPR